MATGPGGGVGGISGEVTRLTGLAAALASMLLAQVGAGQERQAPASQQQFGTVRFETSCSAPVETRFDRAVALLHSFEFGLASDGFADVARADPSCGIAYWGIALAAWGNPFAVGQKSRADPAGAGGDRSGPARRRQERAREGLHRRSRRAVPGRRAPGPAHSRHRLPRRDGRPRRAPPRGHGGRDLLRAGARAVGAA